MLVSVDEEPTGYFSPAFSVIRWQGLHRFTFKTDRQSHHQQPRSAEAFIQIMLILDNLDEWIYLRAGGQKFPWLSGVAGGVVFFKEVIAK